MLSIRRLKRTHKRKATKKAHEVHEPINLNKICFCKALAWRAYLTIFPLHQHNNIKRSPRMRWWVIRYNLIVLSCRSVCYRNPGFAIIYSCHRRKDRRFEVFMRHRGWGSSVLVFPSVLFLLFLFLFPRRGEARRYTTPYHAMKRKPQAVPISTDTTWRRASQGPFSPFW